MNCHIYAGDLLRSAALPAALQAVTADPAEHALYLGDADGRIFELSLVRAPAAHTPSWLLSAVLESEGMWQVCLTFRDPAGSALYPATTEGRMVEMSLVRGLTYARI